MKKYTKTQLFGLYSAGIGAGVAAIAMLLNTLDIVQIMASTILVLAGATLFIFGKNIKNALIALGILLVALIAGFFALNNYIYNAKQALAPAAEEVQMPSFEDYSVSEAERFSGTPAEADLNTSPIGNTFRTRLREGAAQGPNFAGSFTVVQWGCGTNCAQFAIIDAETGEIYDVPWGVETGLDYNLDSRLIVLNPPEPTRNAYPEQIPQQINTRYYEWTGEELRLLFVYKYEDGKLVETSLHEPDDIKNN